MIWIIEGDFKNKFEVIKKSKILLTILVFILLSLFSLSYSSDIELGLNQVRLVLYFLTIFVIATSIKKEDINTIITAFLAGMFVSEVIAYGVFFEFWQFKHATPQNPSPFMVHIEYSVFMAFTSVLLLNRILSKRYTLNEKLIFFFFFLTVTGNLFLATGRTGQVSLIAGIIVLTIIHYRMGLKSLIASFLILSVIFISAYNVSDSFNKRVYQAKTDIEKLIEGDFNTSWGLRVAYWLTTIEILKENPLIGVGIGDYIVETKNILKNEKFEIFSEDAKSFLSRKHPHNQYLLVLIQFGIIGLFFFSFLIYSILKLDIEDEELKELSILFCTIYFVGCLAEPLLIKQFTLSLFVIFIGLFSIQSTKKTL